MENKECTTCKKIKSLNQYRMIKGKYYYGECISCKAASQKEYQKNYRRINREKLKIKAKKYKWDDYKKSDKKSNLKSDSVYCNIKGCTEHKVEYLGLDTYCKSHAFDKLNNI